MPAENELIGRVPDDDRMPVDGHPDDWVKKRLADMGLTEDDIGVVVEGGAGLHAQGGRWRICPGCKSNIDMLTWVRGEEDGEEWPQLLPPGAIECPNCGAYGETFGKSATNEPHPKLKTYVAREIHNPFPWAAKYLKVAKAVIEKSGLFPADPQFDPNEPHWPRDLGACVIAGGMLLASAVRRSVGDGSRPGSRRREQGSSSGGYRNEYGGRGRSGSGNERRPRYDSRDQRGQRDSRDSRDSRSSQESDW